MILGKQQMFFRKVQLEFVFANIFFLKFFDEISFQQNRQINIISSNNNNAS